MIRFLLAATATLALALPAAASGFYATAFGGANMGNDFGGHGPHASFETMPDTGYVVGVALGSHVAALPGVRAEIEASWRSATHHGAFDGCSDFFLDGEDSTSATLVNVVYEADMGDLRPYVLAGAGYGARRISINPTPDNWTLNGTGADEQGFAWQVGAGVDLSLGERWRAGVGYRYFTGPSIDRVAQFGKASTFMEADGDSHALIVTATYGLTP